MVALVNFIAIQVEINNSSWRLMTSFVPVYQRDTGANTT
jgi:hypothetical protein